MDGPDAPSKGVLRGQKPCNCSPINSDRMTNAGLLPSPPSSPPSSPPPPSPSHTPFEMSRLFVGRAVLQLALNISSSLPLPTRPVWMCLLRPHFVLHPDERHEGKAAELAVCMCVCVCFVCFRVCAPAASTPGPADVAVFSCNMQMLVIRWCLECVSL